MKQSGTKIKKSFSSMVFYVLSYSLVLIVALACLLPFVMIISGSLSDETLVARYGFSILPRGFSLQAYKTLFQDAGDILNAYKVTIGVTLAGTLIALILITMTAFVISRRDFKYANAVSFFYFFTTLFNGGIVSTYIFTVKYYHLKVNAR